MSDYLLNDDFQLTEHKKCNVCPSLGCLSNICSCIFFPFKVCIGLSWIGTCGMFFYLGNLYGKGEHFPLRNILNLTDVQMSQELLSE